jgi:hypothetical protein
MPYIGQAPTQAAFVTDTFSGNGSTTAFTMSVAPANTASVLVAVSGVLQDPSTYSVSGLTLTFSGAPPTGTGNISARYLGIPASGVTTTAYRTVTEFTATAGQTTFTPPSYTAGFINVYRNGVLLGSADYTATNGTTVVLTTGATSGDLVTVESFYVSSVLNAIPNIAASVSQLNLASGIAGTGPAFLVYLSAHQAPANNTVVKVAFDTKVYDTASCFNTSTNRFTPTVAGYYQINGALAGYSSNTSLSTLYAYMEKNGSYVAASGVINVPTCLSVATVVSQVIYMNGSTDYLELFGQINATGSSQLFLGTSLVYSTFSGSLIRAA